MKSKSWYESCLLVNIRIFYYSETSVGCVCQEDGIRFAEAQVEEQLLCAI